MPDAATVADVPPLVIASVPLPPKPTATHPRAFRGTKTQPPKPRQRSPIDLRPHLCVPQDTNRLLAYLAPHLEAARKSLQAGGLLLPDRLPCLIYEEGQAVDVYMSNCHQSGHQSLNALPALFRRTLLFWLRGMPWSIVGRVLALYWSLELESHSATAAGYKSFAGNYTRAGRGRLVRALATRTASPPYRTCRIDDRDRGCLARPVQGDG